VRTIQQQALANRVPVWVDVLVDGHFFRSTMVTVEVLADRLQAFAAKDMPAGALLAAGDTEMRFVRIEHFNIVAGLPGRVEAFDKFGKRDEAGKFDVFWPLEGMRVRVPVRRGNLLTALNLLPGDAVVRGDLVELRVQEGDVALLLPAIAQQDGRTGDRVQVTISRSGQGEQGDNGSSQRATVLAEVRGRNLVHAVTQAVTRGASR
jgi:hypothetical protein